MKLCLRKPQVNPVTGKAKQLPIINPIDRHGRVFFFSWCVLVCRAGKEAEPLTLGALPPGSPL